MMDADASNAHGRILSTLLHHLDIDQQRCERIPIPIDASDLERYLNELLSEIETRPQKRQYRLASNSTQFATALNQFFEHEDLDRSAEADAIAQRLLRIEGVTDEKYGHLNPDGAGHVKKGSFLQFTYRETGDLHYLGVKVEHQRFLDEEDLQRKIGLGESQKIYKACKVTFSSEGSVENVLIFDTNTRPSTYWWRDFWELIEQRTDEHNTEQAVKEVTKKLGPLKRKSPVDYTLLRNAVVAAFKQVGRMNFDEFVDNTFSSYQAIDPDAQEEIATITDRIRRLPEVKDFDSQFEIAPAAVPFRRLKIPVTSEITLSYDEGMPNLEEKIWASRTRDGKKVLVLEADQETVDRFTFKSLDS